MITACVLTILFLCPRITFIEGKQILEMGETYRAEDFIHQTNGKVTPESEYLNTEEVGGHSLKYTVKKGIFEREVSFVYEVKDTVPPVITLKKETVYLIPGDVFTIEDMRDNVSVNEGGFSLTSDFDPKRVGSYTVNVTPQDDSGNIATATYNVIIKDIEAPLVLRSGDGAKVLKGSDFNISEHISYGDNADPRPVLEIEGEVDTVKTGSYPLHLTLTDASGNRTAWDIEVEVVSRLPNDEPDDEKYLFEDLVEKYKEDGRMLGIDISSWQGDIDFNKVKEAGCEFVMIRIGWSYKGELTMDKKFHVYLKGAREAGIPTGVYLFCYDNTEEYLLSSLDQVFKELGNTELELPLAFDWENFSNYHEYEISFQDLNHLYDVFEKEAKEKGYETMLYGSAYYLNRIWTQEIPGPSGWHSILHGLLIKTLMFSGSWRIMENLMA